MDKKTGKGRQKIEMKLIEDNKAHIVTLSKRKKGLYKKAKKYSTLTGADVGVVLITPSGKPHFYRSTSIEKITDKFLELKQDDRQRDHDDIGKSNVFETFEDLRKEVQALNEKEKERILRYKIMHPHSEVLPDKHRLEQLEAIKSRLGKIKNEKKRLCSSQANQV
ncbi:agamous-like MADS-box protein AGL29 [Capsicum galapagoense]